MPRVKDVHAIRARREENQETFWNRYGVCQSAGSRIERGGNKLTAPVAMLIEFSEAKTAEELKKLQNLLNSGKLASYYQEK